MAVSTSVKVIKTKRGTWFVDTFVDNIIGQGAYGIVYRGTDEKGNNIAAKRIDTKRKKDLSETMKDLDKLMELDHPNIVKVHDIHEEEGIVWIFMDLCEHGDLDKFFRKKTLSDLELVSVMEQIAEGVSYLHERNIIHRDIKPANILVSSDSPIQVKLTDFDVSKFLEEFFDTSAMSTNVGTLAFKGPEYFVRTKDGKLRYHRKVDEYAVGLTYLAMLQKNGQNKPLKPQIETPQDDSELYLPIGQIISERMKSRMKEHNIVVVQEKKKPSLMKKFSSLFTGETSAQAATVTDGSFVTTEVRKLIQKLTCVIPEDRMSAAEAVRELHEIVRQERQHTPEASGASEKTAYQEKQNTAETSRELEKIVHQCEFRDVKLDRTISWDTGMSQARTICILGDQLLVRGKFYIRLFNRDDGRVIRDLTSECVHSAESLSTISEHLNDANYVLESCPVCKQIRCYNINTGEAQTVYRGAVWRTCPGPSGSVLCVDGKGRIEQLDTQGEGQEFKVKHSVQTGISYVWGMCYVEQYNIVVFTCFSRDSITAVSLGDGSTLWEFKQQVEGKKIDIGGLCHDDDGRIYVTDYSRMNQRLLVLEPQRGELLQVLRVDECILYDVCWTNSPPQLSLLHDDGQTVSVYNVE